MLVIASIELPSFVYMQHLAEIEEEGWHDDVQETDGVASFGGCGYPHPGITLGRKA